MRRAVFVAAPLLGLLLAGCGPAVDGVAVPAITGPANTTTQPSAAVPPQPQPAKAGACPFLDAQEVSYDNGQHVGSVKISDVPAGQTYPMCYFYLYNGQLQLTARVYVGASAVATALVNQATPIATSNPASQPAGWTGGSQASSSGAVYAVAKGGTAIIVTSNRLQTIYCRQVTLAVANKLAGH